MKNRSLGEIKVIKLIVKYLKKEKNWKIVNRKTIYNLHKPGCDIILKAGKRGSERFYIECKGKSKSQNSKGSISVDKEGWLTALGQIITRIKTKSTIQTGKTKGAHNTSYKYGLGLYWVGAQVALKRIPQQVALNLNLYIFSVHENGTVKKFTPMCCGTKYADDIFKN